MINAKISKIEKIAVSVAKISFVAEDGSALPSFTPGAHVDVKVNEDITRQYSLCGSARDINEYSIAVLRDSHSRGGSVAIHDTFREGMAVQISAPKNLFPLGEHDGKVILVAGGIGITPLISMMKSLDDLEKRYLLLYVHKPAQQIPFDKELAAGVNTGKVILIPSESREKTAKRLRELIPAFEDGCGLYTCGPDGFMSKVNEIAREKSWPDFALNQEKFSHDISTTGADTAFTMHLVQSNIHINVSTEQTALEALDEAGIEVDASCEQGICGTCVLRVLDGKVDHRDAWLTDAEKSANDRFTPCCSRALTPSLSIDL